MKLNSTPRHYMPLSQSQSDDDESTSCKEEKAKKLYFKNSFIASNELVKDNGNVEIYEADTKNLPMTSLRKCCFILSLLLCVLFVLIFVFLVPCSKLSKLHGTCRLTKKWKNIHQNMSLFMPLDFFHSEDLKSYIVILGYTSDESGLIAIEGSTGKERWRLKLHSTPTASICNAIDVNLDGYPECIIAGNNGLLTAVDLKRGISLWYLHNHSDLRPVISVGKPMMMPDCDNDDIIDLFIPYLNNGDNSSYLALVSGGTGQVIGSLLRLPQCTKPATAQFVWNMQNGTSFVLYCDDNEGGNLWQLFSKSICDVALNESNRLLIENVFRVPKFTSGSHFYKLSSMSYNYLALVLNGNEIMLLKKNKFSFHVVWSVYLENHYNIRVLTDGKFSQESDQLVISSNYLSHAKVIGLNLDDGKEVWSIIEQRGNITSALKLPKFFVNLDGLIIKVVSFLTPFSNRKGMQAYLRNNSSELPDEVYKNERGIMQLKVDYILVKPQKFPLLTNLNTEEIWSICKENVCRPDVYTTNATVLISTATLGMSVDILVVSSTLQSAKTILPNKEVVSVKYWNLKNGCYTSRCTT